VHGATLANCGNVAFAGCTLFGQPTGPTGNTSGAGLESQNSSIALYDDSIQGAPGHDGFVDALPESPGFGGPGCLLVNGNLFASGSTVHGGDGGSGSPASCSPGPFPGGDALPGATGIYGFPATILDSIVTGGHGGQGGAAAPACGMPGGSSAADGFDFLFPATVLTGQHKTLTAPTLVRELHTLDLQVAGNAGDNVWLSTSNGASWRLSPARRGVVLLSQPSDVSFLGTVPANGVLRASVPIGDLGPGVQDRPLFLQATCIDGAGHVTLTGPAVVVLLDQMF
jgi:hypothetical protein